MSKKMKVTKCFTIPLFDGSPSPGMARLALGLKRITEISAVILLASDYAKLRRAWKLVETLSYCAKYLHNEPMNELIDKARRIVGKK